MQNRYALTVVPNLSATTRLCSLDRLLTFRGLIPQPSQRAFQELPGLFRIVIPVAVCHYIVRSNRSHRQTQRIVSLNPANEGSEFHLVSRIAENESGLGIAEYFACTGIRAGDDREATGHGFQDGKPEGVPQGRADIEIGSCVERHYVEGRLCKAYPILQFKLINQRAIQARLIIADNKHAQGEVFEQSGGSEKSVEPFSFPIIPD